MLYLRGYSKLRSLSVAGNPLCKDEHHDKYIIAYIPQLRYLDYRRISDEMVCMVWYAFDGSHPDLVTPV